MPNPDQPVRTLQTLLDQINQQIETLSENQKPDITSLLPQLGRLEQNIRSLLDGSTPNARFPVSETELYPDDRYRILLESITDGLLSIDRDWIIRYLNEKAIANAALKPEELIGKKLWETFPGLLGTHLETIYRQVMDHREPSSLEMKGVLSEKWYRINVYPSGEGITVLWLDITDRRRAEIGILTAHQRLSEILASIQDVFYSVDSDWRIIYANPAAADQWEKEIEDLIGKDLWKVFPEAKGSAAYQQLQQAMHDQQPTHFEAMSPIVKSWIDVHAYPTREGGLVVYFRDIGDRKRVEAEIYQQAAQVEVQRSLLEQREQERVQIARDLHDGPVQELSGAVFALQVLAMDSVDPDTKVEIEKIQASLATQIDELRAYAGELRPPALAHFGLEKAIQSYVETFHEKHPDIQVRFHAHQVGKLTPEPMRLAVYRIVQEAMTNIVKHAQATEVDIRFEKDDHRAILEIQDNGVGFEFTLDWLSLVRHGHLGLVGMRERAEAVGGQLSVSSNPGDGVTIRIEIPLDDA
jgi:PAS domain S-box-containing protein